jgi:FKBP-type peptidyl-prolyl cis-trans isomerase FkpA
MKYLMYAVLAIALFGCSKDKEPEVDQRAQIMTYLEANGLDATETSSGLFYKILNEGSGRRPADQDLVQVSYKGWLLDDSVFDESDSNGRVFRLGGLIAAWREGLPKIKSGGRIRLYCPSKLGYGSTARPNIPANSVLVFDISLKAVFD